MGRPSLKTEAVVDEIFERLAMGQPLAQICKDAHMPAFSTVWRWEDSDAEFRNLSARAREHGTHFMADDCIRIADDCSLEPQDKKVRIDTRLRLIGKWNAKRYGDASTVKLADADGEKLPMGDVERATRLAAIFAQIEQRRAEADAD